MEQSYFRLSPLDSGPSLEDGTMKPRAHAGERVNADRPPQKKGVLVDKSGLSGCECCLLFRDEIKIEVVKPILGT